jgi:ubiquinone/menaquinone biosynthesis C-methylase UbiE
VSFDVGAGAYARFMGRFSEPLAIRFLDFTGAREGWRALDVGCGPGALTARLADRLGAAAVAAVDPSASFVVAARDRFPGLEVQLGFAEVLPWPDDSFDLAAAQLVVPFMRDPDAGLRQMRRVTRPGGVVAACTWDHAGGTGPLSLFWRAARRVDPTASGEGSMPGVREGDLEALFERTGLHEVESSMLTVRVGFTDLEEWWEPYTLGVGPAGAYVAGLDEAHRAALREECASLLPAGPFEVVASAWAVRGLA